VSYLKLYNNNISSEITQLWEYIHTLSPFRGGRKVFSKYPRFNSNKFKYKIEENVVHLVFLRYLEQNFEELGKKHQSLKSIFKLEN